MMPSSACAVFEIEREREIEKRRSSRDLMDETSRRQEDGEGEASPRDSCSNVYWQMENADATQKNNNNYNYYYNYPHSLIQCSFFENICTILFLPPIPHSRTQRTAIILFNSFLFITINY